jgi:hypothetical protein
VRSCTTRDPLARLRAHALAKLCALWFVVLILLPFTAPFPTYHLHNASSNRPYDALPKDLRDKLDSDEKLGLPSHWSPIPALLQVVIVNLFPTVSPRLEHVPRHTVLRI